MTDTSVSPAPDAATARQKFRYIPALDGMRGFWVVFGPLLYHARPESVAGGPDILPGGILGVDMFFVLSSYLITGIALNELESTGRIDLVAYAGRRIRRLFPALFALLTFLGFYAALSDPEAVPRWTGAMVSALLYVANWYEIASGVDYFEQFANPSPLKHVWSFSIEEQFYLFAPLFILATNRLFPNRFRRALLIGAITGALLSAWWMAQVHIEGDGNSISRAYYGTDTRAQAFFVGISMAVMVRSWGPVRKALNSKIVAVLAYPATAWFFWAVLNVSERDDWMFERGGFLLAAVMSAIILHGLSQNAPWSPLHRIFESRPFLYVGKISYGLYLYHWPVYLLVNAERAGRWTGIENPSGYVLLSIHLVITFALAAFSFRFIEEPFTKRRFPGGSIKLDLRNGVIAGSFAVIAILAGLLWANSDRPNDVEQVFIDLPAADGSEPEVDFGEENIAGADDGSAIDQEAALETPASRATRVLVVGDSVSAQIGWAMYFWGEDHPDEVVVFNESHLGCGVVRYGDKRVNDGDVGPVGDICSSWADPVAPHLVADSEIVSWVTAVDLFQPDVVIAHVSSWDVSDRIVPGVVEDWASIGDPAYDDYVRSEYAEATELLGASGAEVYWLMSPYLNRAQLPDDHQARVDGINALVTEAVASVPDTDVTLLDYPGWIGPVGGPRDIELRDDGVHLTQQAFDEIGPWLIEQIGLR